MPRAWVSDPRYDIRGIGNIRNSKARGECVFAAHSVPGPAVCGAEGRGRHGGRERRRQRVSLRCRNRAGLSAGERLDARSLSQDRTEEVECSRACDDMRCGGNRAVTIGGGGVDRVACAPTQHETERFRTAPAPVIVADGDRRRATWRRGSTADRHRGRRLEVGGGHRAVRRERGAAVATLAPTIPGAEQAVSGVEDGVVAAGLPVRSTDVRHRLMVIRWYQVGGGKSVGIGVREVCDIRRRMS